MNSKDGLNVIFADSCFCLVTLDVILLACCVIGRESLVNGILTCLSSGNLDEHKYQADGIEENKDAGKAGHDSG